MADMAELLSRAAETPSETALMSSVYTRRVCFSFEVLKYFIVMLKFSIHSTV